jgi:hypothetical protein
MKSLKLAKRGNYKAFATLALVKDRQLAPHLPNPLSKKEKNSAYGFLRCFMLVFTAINPLQSEVLAPDFVNGYNNAGNERKQTEYMLFNNIPQANVLQFSAHPTKPLRMLTRYRYDKIR